MLFTKSVADLPVSLGTKYAYYSQAIPLIGPLVISPIVITSKAIQLIAYGTLLSLAKYYDPIRYQNAKEKLENKDVLYVKDIHDFENTKTILVRSMLNIVTLGIPALLCTGLYAGYKIGLVAFVACAFWLGKIKLPG